MGAGERKKRVHGDPRGQGIGAKIRPANRSRASARLDPKAHVPSQKAVSPANLCPIYVTGGELNLVAHRYILHCG